MTETKKEKSYSEQAVENHHKRGISHTDPRTGEDLSGKHLWLGAAVPEATHISEHAPTAKEHEEFTKLHSDLLSRHENAHVMTHKDEGTGLHKMDIAFGTPSKHIAIAAAQHFGADKVHHAGTGETVETGANKDELLNHPIDARFHSIRELSPKKSPYIGEHFSNSKLDKIEGSRRGMPDAKGNSAGEEAARVRLGTHSGKGPDAVPGFYTYAKGTLPDLGISQRPHSHEVTGNFAIGSTDHPEFRKAHAVAVHLALSRGASIKTAAALGINAGEKALHEHGFDGYSNPARPGTTFHFGDYHVEQKEKK